MSIQPNLLESWKDIYQTIDQDRIEKISICPFISKIGIMQSDQTIDKKYLTIFFAFIERLFMNYQIEYIDHICNQMEQRKNETNCIIQIDTILNFIYQLKKTFILDEKVEMTYADFLFLREQIYQLIQNQVLFAAFIPFATAYIQFQPQESNLQLEKYDKDNVQKLCNILKMNIKVLLAKPDKITISANKYFPHNRTKMDKTIIIVEKNKSSVHVAYDSSNERLHRFCYQGKLIYQQNQQFSNSQNPQSTINNQQLAQQNIQLQQENQLLNQQILNIQEGEAQIKLQNAELKQKVQKYDEQEIQLKYVFQQLRPLLQTMLDNQNKQLEQLKQNQPYTNKNTSQPDQLSQQLIQLNYEELQLKQQLQLLFFPTNGQQVNNQIQQYPYPLQSANQQWIKHNNQSLELQHSQILLEANNSFKSQQNFDQMGQIKSQSFESNPPNYPQQINYFQNSQKNYIFNQSSTQGTQNPISNFGSVQQNYFPVQNKINQQQITNENKQIDQLPTTKFENRQNVMRADQIHTIKTNKRGNIQLNKEDTQSWTNCKQILDHRKKQKILECPICCQTKKNDDLVLLKCGHSFCQECLKEHINSLISQGKRSFDFFTCLHCSLRLDPVELFSMLTDKQRSQIDEYYKDRNINFKCPNQKCGLQSKIQEKECLLKELFVTSCCKSKVCSKCKQLYHPDTKCQSQIKEMIDQIGAYREQQTTENAMLFRFCPVCFQFAFKDEGCDHVTCIKCKSDFCFSCSAPRPSILGHGNHYHRQQCRYFGEYKDQKGNKVDNELNLKKCDQCQKTKQPCQRPITWDQFLTEVQNEIGTEIFEAFPDNFIL
ncbi:hypothetical protein ABPG74_006448 [Tetrahymena malaccensis]